MNFFEQFNSNTYAGSGNQIFFEMEKGEVRTGRIFYKISVGGEYNYSLLFSNIIDSTYAQGDISRKNLICDSWTIHHAAIGKCKTIPSNKELAEMTVADEGEKTDTDITVSGLKKITFNGQDSKEVMPGEFFCSDPIKYSYEKDEYLCLEITFSGAMIPYHKESILPVFVKEKGEWTYSRLMPFAGMLGCDRDVEARIAYLGDSITQGIGVKYNSYAHWNALLSEKISEAFGDKYAFWNLGLGYGKANDAASDGAWLYKARHNDIVFVCYGVNDIYRGETEEQIKSDLAYIVDNLKKAGAKVILQTVPPYEYAGENIGKWERINEFIKTVLKERADLIFDTVPYLDDEARHGTDKFGGHPNEEGCAIWAEALFEAVKTLFM